MGRLRGLPTPTPAHYDFFFFFERSHRLNYIRRCKITGNTQCRLATAILSSGVGEQTAGSENSSPTGRGSIPARLRRNASPNQTARGRCG